MTLSEWERPFTLPGIVMVLLGMLFVLIPHLARYAPEIEKLPPILLYVYRWDNFYFATSPILIIISIISVLISLFSRYTR
jgi:type II secretory pathway component PulF